MVSYIEKNVCSSNVGSVRLWRGYCVRLNGGEWWVRNRINRSKREETNIMAAIEFIRQPFVKVLVINFE